MDIAYVGLIILLSVLFGFLGSILANGGGSNDTHSDQRIFFRTFMPLFGVSLVIAFGGAPWGTDGFARTLGVCTAIATFASFVMVWTCACSRDSDRRVKDANNKWAEASNEREHAMRELAKANEDIRLLCEAMRAEIASLRSPVDVIVAPEIANKTAKTAKRARARR